MDSRNIIDAKTVHMIFRLFSKTEFEVRDPITLIESYCYMTHFYADYDLPLANGDRKIDLVGEIGARIHQDTLAKCERVIKNHKNVKILGYDLDGFLALDNEDIAGHIRELCDGLFKELMAIEGIRLSTATKILHTLYPAIIPIIDSMLQGEYRQYIQPGWRKDRPEQILVDHYLNLKREPTKRNLTTIYDAVSKTLPGLTKIRIFDILWWSYLKAKVLKRQSQKISLSSIK